MFGFFVHSLTDFAQEGIIARMKDQILRIVCLIGAALLFFALYGRAEQEKAASITPAALPTATAEPSASAAPEPQESASVSQMPTESPAQESAPESTTVTGQSGADHSTAQGSASASASPDVPSEAYTGDGYSFRYHKGTRILTDTETSKSFQFPDGKVLNVTRLNLSGQALALDKALDVYRQTLETQGNTVKSVGKLDGFPYENAVLEMEIKEGNGKATAAQVFFFADDYNYTFTVSARNGDMAALKKAVEDVVKTFSAA